MVESNYTFVSTSRLFVDRNYRSIPSFKAVKRTRLFDDDLYAHIPGLSLYKNYAYVFGDNTASIDRTQTITTPFNTTLHPALRMPSGTTNKTFAECCDERASSYLRSGKYINVMYGGGIDSVAMLAALLKNATHKDQINLLMSNSSIIKNEQFYDKHICGKLNVIPSYDFDKYLGKQDSILITGECGDEIFGSSFIQNLMYITQMDLMVEEPTLSTVSDILKRNLIIETDEEREMHRRFIDLLFLVAEKSPVELDTVYKFFWWLNYCLNWNVAYTRLMSYSKVKVNPEVDYVPFFASQDFQMWSVSNVDALSLNKTAAQEYIHEYSDVQLGTTIKTSNVQDICYNKQQACVIGSDMLPKFEVPNNLFLQENSFV